MNRLLLPASLAALFLLLPPTVPAVPRSVSRSLVGEVTLDRAVQIALAQNPDVLTQIQTIERTKGQVISVRAQALPHLVLSGSFNQQDRRLIESGGSSRSSSGTPSVIVIAPDGTSTTGGSASIPGLSELEKALGGTNQNTSTGPSDKSYQIQLEVQQVLYSGGQVLAGIRIAKLTEDSAYFQLRSIIDTTIATTRQQFYTVLLSRALIKVQEESVRVLSDQLKDQQNRFEAGTVPRFNVLQAEVALSNVRPDLIRAKNNYLIAQLQLAKTLGLDPGPGGKVTFNVVGELGVAQRPLNLSSALDLARERNPFLKVQRQSILIQTEQIKVALAGYKPKLNASAGYQLRNSSLSDDLEKTVDGWFYGITGTWNIFDGLDTYGQVKQARAQLETSRITYLDSVQQVELQVQQAFANVQTALATIESQRKGVEQALEALRLASERLAAGAGTQLDVLNARLALTQAQTTELQARSDYNVALAEFDRVTATDTVYAEMFQDPLAIRKKPLVAEQKAAPAAKKAAPAATKKPAGQR